AAIAQAPRRFNAVAGEEVAVVEEEARPPDDERLHSLLQAQARPPADLPNLVVRAPRGHVVEHVHRVVGVEVDDHLRGSPFTPLSRRSFSRTWSCGICLRASRRASGAISLPQPWPRASNSRVT